MNLKKVTPKALKVYDKHGLMNFEASDMDAAKATLSVMMDMDALAEICDVTFEEAVVDLENADLSEITEGIQDFLSQLSGRRLK